MKGLVSMQNLEGARILIVDDEIDFCKSLSKVLRRRGFVVEIATDGLLGLSFLAREQFDLVLLDLKMPGMGGAQLLVEMKRLALETKVIVITGHLASRSEEERLRGRVFAYLIKPVPMMELLDKIMEALSKPMQSLTW
jgi:DNA-binding NtrC family response regulator